jgi:nitroimidazol reductase NimA-like FMN-containing flavoprotein (pyridoxamine 5'-phosphate oxidase superfamily)
MNFGFDDAEIILHSATEGKHIELLKKDNRVSLTFCTERKLRFQHPDVACSYSMESASVICIGAVSFVADDDLSEKERAMNLFMKNYSGRAFKYSKPALRNVKVWKVRIESFTAKAFGQNYKK